MTIQMKAFEVCTFMWSCFLFQYLEKKIQDLSLNLVFIATFSLFFYHPFSDQWNHKWHLLLHHLSHKDKKRINCHRTLQTDKTRHSKIQYIMQYCFDVYSNNVIINQIMLFASKREHPFRRKRLRNWFARLRMIDDKSCSI